MRTVYNLTKFADASKHARRLLLSHIQEITSLELTLKDLRDARGMIRELGRQDSGLAMGELSQQQDLVGRSLFMSSLILYARATELGSKGKARVKFKDALNQIQRKTHDRMLSLRNNGLAHYGYGDDLSNEWSKAICVLIVDGDQWNIGVTGQFFNYKGNYQLELLGLIDVVEKYLIDTGIRKREEIFSLISSQFDANKLMKGLLRHVFDPEAFFSNRSNGERFADGDLNLERAVKSPASAFPTDDLADEADPASQ